jgi:3-oxoacyl-[acyl-carrier protein] reductase
LINAEIVVQTITNKYKAEASAISLSIADANAVNSALKAISEKWGPVNVWVNTSNLFHRQEAFEMQDGELHHMISTNMKELFRGSSAVAHHMMRSGVEGIVINVISLKDFAALNGLSNLDEVEQYMTDETRALSDQFKKHGIKIFTIAPIGKGDVSDKEIEIEKRNLGEYTLPDDLAMLVVFCISILSRTTSGKVVRLHGKNILINTKN